MAKKIQIEAVETVRCIRDEQAKLLAGKSNAETIAFFRKAGEAARRQAGKKKLARDRSQRNH